MLEGSKDHVLSKFSIKSVYSRKFLMICRVTRLFKNHLAEKCEICCPFHDVGMTGFVKLDTLHLDSI